MASTQISLVALTLALLCASTLADSGWLIVAGNKADAQAKSARVVQASRTAEGDPVWGAWWANFKLVCNKTYANANLEQQAFTNFRNNMLNVAAINANNSISHWASGNCMFEYSFAQIQTMLLTIKAPANHSRLLRDTELPSAGRQLLQSSVDWRTAGKVTTVKDQGGCGGCWAFAATAAMESAYLITKGTTAGAMPSLDLSEQEMISCATASGCNGGGSDSAMMYAAQAGQTTEAIYPYQSGMTGQTGACNSGLVSSLQPGQMAKPSAYASYVPTYSEQALMQRVAIQPTVFYFSVVGDFFSYAGGVYYPTSCAGAVNHAMVVVGYVWTGVSSNSYWIIRNSWSSGWGQSGYAYIAMTGQGSAGACNMYTFLVYPPLSFTTTLSGTPGANPAPATSPSPRPPSPSPSPSPRSPPPSPRPPSPRPPSPRPPSPRPPSPRPPSPRPPSPSPSPAVRAPAPPRPPPRTRG